MGFQTTPDWFGKVSPFRPEMSLECSDTQLHFRFRVQKAPFCDQSLGLGDFVEGLWQKDVAELFLAGRGSHYQEINVSPTGAWWSASFSDYRVLQQEVRFQPRIEVKMEQTSWQVDFSAPLEGILPFRDLEPREFRFSPTAILYSPEPHYFAWNHKGGGEPDFHRADLLGALT